MISYQNAKDYVKNWIRKYQGYMLFFLIFSFLLNFSLMAYELVNSYDGLWWHSIFYAKEWERSIGRWFWPYIDHARFGICSVALNSCITFVLEILAICMLIEIFEIKRKFQRILFGVLFLSSPLLCEVLSYAYMSPTFGSAFLTSVIAFAIIVKQKNWILSIVGGSIYIAISMGCYQAYLGVTCILTLLYFMKQVLKQDSFKALGGTVVKLGGSVLIGGLLYKICVEITNKYYEVELTDYKGINNVSAGAILKNLPASIKRTYTDFYAYFFKNSIIVRNYGAKYILAVAFVVTLILILILLWRLKLPMIYTAMFLVAIVLIPLFCNVTLLLAYETGTILLMTAAMGLLLGGLIAVFGSYQQELRIYDALTLILLVCAWLNVCATTNDQIVLHDGKNATTTLTRAIVQELISEDYLHEDTVIAFAGRPSDSPYFRKTEAFENANDYAKFGQWWVDAGNNRRSWYYGMLRHYLGLELNWCDDDDYEEIRSSGELESMPNFPEEGSIKVINDIVVVKVSDVH